MSEFLKLLKGADSALQKRISEKLKDNLELTDEEVDAYQLTDSDNEILGYVNRVVNGEHVQGFMVKDFLASPQAKVLIPKFVIGAAKMGADPVYLASNFFKKVKLKNGNAVIFPQFGVMRAYDVSEGAEIPAENIDWNTYTDNRINVGKVGLRIQYTDDLIQETEFDIVGILSSEAGRALAKHKEEKAFVEFRKRGWVVFDNELYRKDPVANKLAATGGVDFEGNLNGTLSLEDWLDLAIAVYNNGYTPDVTVMNALAFPAFIKNGLTGALTAAGGEEHAKYQDVNKAFTLGPSAIAGKLPFGFNVMLSPFAPVNRQTRTFDLITVDKNNVGFLIEKMNIKTEGFRDPARDLNNLKQYCA